MKVGFVVNPIAGMGGSVGLKGTDGLDTLKEAVKRGATAQAPARAATAARSLVSIPGLDVITCTADMGGTVLRSEGVKARAIYAAPKTTKREDTIRAVRAFVEEHADLILFAGGDGTARDVFDVTDRRVPILGIPAGVKMHSAVFAHSPRDIGHVVRLFSENRTTKDAEIMDVDEEMVRQGRLDAKLYGYALVPDDSAHIQSGKAEYHGGSANEEAEELAAYLSDQMEPGTLYILGPGSTLAKVAEVLGQDKTLLGVDAILDSKMILKDASEKGLLDLLAKYPRARIVITPIGGQGFILGRGNQQISARIVERAGPENVVVVATPTKLKETPLLRVDTGDERLDSRFRGRMRVITGYKRRRLVPVV